MKIKHLSELDALKLQISTAKRVVLTGPSGVGKSYIGALLNATGLDKYGDSIDGKWIIDLNKLNDDIVNGVTEVVCDNMSDVIEFIQPNIVVIVSTRDYDMFRQMQAAKAKDYKGKNEAWRSGWLNKSRLSDSSVRKYLDDKTSRTIDLVRHVSAYTQIIIFYNRRNANLPISAGWHKR